MMFATVRIDALPPMAWLFEQDAGREPVAGTLVCGSAVEVDDQGFAEGCAAIPPGGSLVDAETVCGSGARRVAGRWIFVTPSHSCEALFTVRDGSGWAVSNSLALLVARRKLDLDWDLSVSGRMATVAKGIDVYDTDILPSSGGMIRRFVHVNLAVDADGTLAPVPKPAAAAFADFAAYRAHLAETLRQLFLDGARPTRARALRPLSTCSSGYDSACVSALVAPLGCEEAVTLVSSRDGDDDSGRAVGEMLGLRVHEFPRSEVENLPFDDLLLFLASGMGGEDLCYWSFSPLLEGRILLTGFHGDKVWDLQAPANTVIARGDISGCSMQEFRLRRNFVHVPVPMISALNHPDILEIARQDEMRPFRLGNTYDRPIPRRIVEEAGVGRQMFGQDKKAASNLVFKNHRWIDPRFRERLEAEVPGAVMAKARSRNRIWGLQKSANRKIAGLRRRGIPVPDFSAIGGYPASWKILEHSSPVYAAYFLSALRMVAADYGDILRAAGTAAGPPAMPLPAPAAG